MVSGYAAGLCGKPVAFRSALIQSFSEAAPRNGQGAALPEIKIAAYRKGRAFPHNQAAEPQQQWCEHSIYDFK
jgi:hypothetical protein